MEIDIGSVSLSFTILVFGALGWWIASQRSKRTSPWMYVALLVAAIAGYFVGVDTRLLDVYGFQVLLNWVLVSCCIGGCAGILTRNSQLRRLDSA